MSVRKVTVRLLADISGYVSPLKAAAKATSDLRKEIAKTADGGKLDKLGASAGRMRGELAKAADEGKQLDKVGASAVSPLKAAAKATSDLRGELAKTADEGKLDKVGASAGTAVSPLKAAAKATSDLRGELAKAANEGKLDKVGDSAGRMGLALSGGFLLAATAAARFERAMSEVDAVANASAGELQQLSDAALKAGKDTQYSATEAAKAEAELAKAGLSASDILGGALTGSLSLAAAGQLDLGEAADTAAKAMNIFNLGGKDVGHVADVLAAAANKSATDVHELAFALKMGGLAAKNSGVSLEETIGTFAAFADNALTGSDAGTSFKTMLQMLAAPTEKSTAKMKELGIQAYDASGNFVGMASLAGILQEKLRGLTEQQRNEAFATIFGSDATRAATVLFNEGEKGIREYTAAVDDQGAAAETARKLNDNLNGDIEKLTGSLETLFIEAGTGANGGLRTLVQILGGIVDAVSALPAPVLTAGTVLLGLSGFALLAFSAFVKVRGATADMVAELRAAGPVSRRLATGIEAGSKAAARAAAVFAGLQIAGALLSAAFDKDLNPQLDALGDSLARFGDTGKLGGEGLRVIGGEAGDLGRILNGVANSGFGAFSDGATDMVLGLVGLSSPLDDAREKAKAMDSALAGLVTSGHSDAAAAAFKRVWEEAQRQGISLEALQAAFPEYTAAADTAGVSTSTLADKTADLARQTGFAVREGQTLVSLWDELNGRALSADEAMLAARDAVDAVGEAFAEGGADVVGHTRAAEENRVALEKAARAASDAAEAYLKNGGNAAGAAQIMSDFQAAAENATGATGKARDAVHGLANQLFQLPTNKTINISVNYKVSQSQLNKVADQLARFDPNRWGGAYTHNRFGGAYTHAAVGVLRDAAVYTPRGPARYAIAEPATGGEAFVPKRGDYGRSMGILGTAAGWYGAKVVPQGWYGGTAGGGASTTAASAPIDYGQLGRAVAAAMRQSPMQGDVILDGQRVGAIQGRQADLYTRGG